MDNTLQTSDTVALVKNGDNSASLYRKYDNSLVKTFRSIDDGFLFLDEMDRNPFLTG